MDLTFTPPESFTSGQFWGIYALIGGVTVNTATKLIGNSLTDSYNSQTLSRTLCVPN